MCPHPKMNRKGTANWSLISKIIREAAPQCGSICPFLMQEPTLEPRLKDILANIKQNNPACATVIYSNMGVYNPKVWRFILNYNLLDELHISFYGPTRELYNKWQPPLKWEKTIKNIHNLSRLRKKMQKTKPTITMHVLNVPEILEKSANYKVFEDIVDAVVLVQYDTFHGDMPDYAGDQTKTMGQPAPRTPCQRLWTGMNIHFDGSVVPCCIDWRDQHVIGNANTQSLAEIWTSEKFRILRQLHIQRRWDEIDMCRECTVHEYQFSKEWIEIWAGNQVTAKCLIH